MLHKEDITCTKIYSTEPRNHRIITYSFQLYFLTSLNVYPFSQYSSLGDTQLWTGYAWPVQSTKMGSKNFSPQKHGLRNWKFSTWGLMNWNLGCNENLFLFICSFYFISFLFYSILFLIFNLIFIYFFLFQWQFSLIRVNISYFFTHSVV